MKKTITLTDDCGTPVFTILKGHKTATEFNRAFNSEGWSRGDWICKDELTHGFCKPLARSAWRKCEKTTKGAVAVTIMDW